MLWFRIAWRNLLRNKRRTGIQLAAIAGSMFLALFIANMTLGRKRMGGQAITVLNLDSPVSEELLAEIKKIPNINDARLVQL